MRGECHLRQCQYLFGGEPDLLRCRNLQFGSDVWRLADMRRGRYVRIRAPDLRRFTNVCDRADVSGGAHVLRAGDVRWIAHLCTCVYLWRMADLPGATV